MRKNKEEIRYTEMLTRLGTLLKEIKNIAEEIGTNDMVLVAHLLILDSIRYKTKKHFKGVETTRKNQGRIIS